MPLYEFEKVSDPKITETFYFPCKDAPKIGGFHTDENGVEWKRILTVFNAPMDTVASIDPFNQNDFIEKTGKKKGTFGDILDASKELSEKRKKERGEDPVQKKYFEEYKKKRHGVQHLEERRQKKVEKNDFTISYTN